MRGLQRPAPSSRSVAGSGSFDRLPDVLRTEGYALLAAVFDASACDEMIAWYGDDERYRNTVTMAKHGFGRGEYRYFRYPLPPKVAELREALYARLAPLANEWNDATGVTERYPAALDAYLTECHAVGQTRPTPLILRYREGDFNCLHQDTYGERAFPLQATVFLSSRADFTGGESILTFGRPRAQTRAVAIAPERGDVLVFPNRYRPVPSARGFARENVRHGVSPIRSGERYALGVIFHDAR